MTILQHVCPSGQSTGIDGNYRSRKITARRWLHKYVEAECGASSFTWYLYQMCNTDVRLSVRPSGEVSGHLLEKAWREWPKILHADVSWPPSELIRLWSRSVDFSNFGTILTQWNGSNLGFPGISQRTHGGNGLKCCMLMYLDHLQNCLVYAHGLLICQIFALFWLSETGQIWGFRAYPGERMWRMVWNFACWCILITFRIN